MRCERLRFKRERRPPTKFLAPDNSQQNQPSRREPRDDAVCQQRTIIRSRHHLRFNEHKPHRLQMVVRATERSWVTCTHFCILGTGATDSHLTTPLIPSHTSHRKHQGVTPPPTEKLGHIFYPWSRTTNGRQAASSSRTEASFLTVLNDLGQQKAIEAAPSGKEGKG